MHAAGTHCWVRTNPACLAGSYRQADNVLARVLHRLQDVSTGLLKAGKESLHQAHLTTSDMSLLAENLSLHSRSP